jgi:transposase
VKLLHERVAGIDVHKDMIKVAIRSPGQKPWTRKTEIFEFRTFYGVLQETARQLRQRGVTHVAMEASGVYTDPVYYALAELDFTEVIVVNPAHVKALKGHKTDAKDCARLAELLECGLLHGSFIPSAEQRQVRDLTRYRALCRHRHSIRYAEARIMPSGRAACRPRVAAGGETSA